MNRRIPSLRSSLRTPAVLVLTLGALGLLAGSPVAGQEEATGLRRHVEYLTSEELEGRLTGTGGARLAAEYLVGELEKLGAEPLPGREGFLRPFEFTAGTSDTGSTLALSDPTGQAGWAGTDKVQALSFSDTGEVNGPLVFAGYGLVIPESQDYSYDSYATLDVEDKIVMVLRYFPEDVDQETRTLLARYSGLRYKAMQARERGAKALLVVSGPRSPNAGETIPMKFDTAIAGSGIVAASINGEVAERLFAGLEDKTLESVQKSFDDGNPHSVGFEIQDLVLTLNVKVKREQKIGQNVLAVLPGNGELTDKPWIVFGAHYDHLGRGGGGNSLARKEEEGGIHYGADDNAGGVAAVLEAGSRLAQRERQRSVLLAFWSGEELGLLGSAKFMKEDPPIAADEIAAYVNMDMVGRMRDNKLSLQAVGSSSIWPRMIEQVNVPVGFDIQTADDPYLPNDSTTFYQASVPSIQFFTGSHEDYHRPSDTAEKLNYEDLERV
ncbi:MAG: M20/M25/M40 family metallo-hydrolase, partial [Acidobacteriota bacterium]|nr:M20/M25/M40 family metallo-hydrolase [Acidobacteriota bacterium]